jgi:hypothetical protein
MVQMTAARIRALLAALAVLGVTGLTSVALAHLDRVRVTDRAQAEAQLAAMRGLDALHALVAGFEVQVQNATSNPRLVAALDAGVDRETLRDLLLNEPWWEPFRLAVEGFGLVRDGDRPEVGSHLPDAVDVGELVRRARTTRRPASELAVADGRVLAAVAAPIPLTGRAGAPVLVATKLLDVGTLVTVAERAGGAAGISDGRHLLVGAAAASGGNLAEVRQQTSIAAPGVRIGSGAREAVAAIPVAGDLRLVVHVRLGSAPGAPGEGWSWPPWATLLVGAAAAAAVFLRLGRRPLAAPAAAVVAAARPSGTGRVSTAIRAVGRYSVVERIGQGGMSEIYSAVTTGDAGFRRAVVIKRLRAQLNEEPAAVAQFCDEANLLAALHHPNIVAVQDFGRDGEQLFLAEEYVLGRDLGRVLKASMGRDAKALSPEVVAHVAHEVLRALDYAHTMRNDQGVPLGIVHRDVSPENIMISERGEVKLLDFGVVKSAAGMAKTDAGVVKGNLTFMSPEQARGQPIDARTDLYALAMVVYYALTGKPLFESETSYGLLLQAGAGPKLKDWAAIAGLPPPFPTLLRKAWAPRIEERYQTAQEMAAAFEPLVGTGAPQARDLMDKLFGEDLKIEARRLADAAGVTHLGEGLPT